MKDHCGPACKSLFPLGFGPGGGIGNHDGKRNRDKWALARFEKAGEELYR